MSDPTAETDQQVSLPDSSQQPPKTLLEEMGGIGGLIATSVPIIVFVAVNGWADLTPAIWAAVGSALAVTLWRLLRRDPLTSVIGGLFGVALCVFIAYRTGSAKGFFLFGIWTSLIYGAIFLVSVLMRWPIVGLIWSFLNTSSLSRPDTSWRSDRKILRGYDLATLLWGAVFAARYVVQSWLYDADHTGWLAVARLLMGSPLTAIALVISVWAIRRADIRINSPAHIPAISSTAQDN